MEERARMRKRLLWVDIVSREEIREMLDSRNLVIASVARRLTAYGIDVGLTLLISCFIVAVAYGGTWQELRLTKLRDIIIATWFCFWISMPLYYALCNPMLGKTIGCRLSKISIISLGGQKIGIVRAYFRGLLLATITIGLFPLIIILHSFLTLVSWKGSDLKRTWWDLGSGTIVVQEVSNES